MKNFTLTILLLWLSFSFLQAQNCLPDGIIFYNQASIDAFQTNYPDCTQIDGDVTIGNDGYLTDITNLNGLNVITHIGGTLFINTNENLTSLTGLDALETIGGGFIVENNGITDFTGLGALTSIQGKFHVLNNSILDNFSGLSSLTTVVDIFEMGHNLVFSEFTGLSSLTSTGGLSMTYLHNVPNLVGLNSLTTIDGDLIINTCHTLINLDGLNMLQTVTGIVRIDGNPELVSLVGLEGLTSVGSGMFIWTNDKLENLIGLSHLASINGPLEIAGGDVLASLNGLETLTNLNGPLKIGGNNKLSSLAGIDNIPANTISDLTIEYNPSLSTCDVQSICDYLQSPSGNLIIRNNANGCNSNTEVLASCGTGLIDLSLLSFSVYPNPAHTEITIRTDEGLSINMVAIINHLGQTMSSYTSGKSTIDISELPQGVYTIQILSPKGKARRLFIKE